MLKVKENEEEFEVVGVKLVEVVSSKVDEVVSAKVPKVVSVKVVEVDLRLSVHFSVTELILAILVVKLHSEVNLVYYCPWECSPPLALSLLPHIHLGSHCY